MALASFWSSKELVMCLNPSFSGIWPVADIHTPNLEKEDIVLILLLVEYGLWLRRRHSSNTNPCPCLNPSFSGIWPVAMMKTYFHDFQDEVLILLLVEYGLWP